MSDRRNFLVFKTYTVKCVAKVYAVLHVSTVKCLYSGGQNEGGRKAAPISISLFDFYDVKTL